MQLRGVCLAAGLFLLALSLWEQPAEAAVSSHPPIPPAPPSPHSHTAFTACPFNFTFSSALGIQICSHLFGKETGW